MSKNKNKTKYGNYIKKVGYFDIRQKVVLGGWIKNMRGENVKKAGSTEVFVYHGKHVMTGSFKSVMAAEAEANKMIAEGTKYKSK
jgi:hypothetical protein|tara:strand:- start:286 stop:540 length:255 start_codon:yes stop_codon:yes gene_type:complete